MFVLAGNFTSKKAGECAGADGGADYPGLRDGFNSLAAVIERHSKIKARRGRAAGQRASWWRGQARRASSGRHAAAAGGQGRAVTAGGRAGLRSEGRRPSPRPRPRRTAPRPQR
jgi:hypothetical protein